MLVHIQKMVIIGISKTMAYEVIFKITIVENYYGKKNKKTRC